MKELKVMLQYILRHKWRVIIGLLCLIIVDSAQLIIPRILKYAVDDIATKHFHHTIFTYALFIVFISLFIAFFRYWWRYFVFDSARLIEKEMHQEIFEHVLTLNPQFFQKYPTGDVMARITNDVNAVRMAVGIGVVAATDTLILSILSLFMMVKINLLLTLYALIPLPALTIITFFFSRVVHIRFGNLQAAFSSITEKVRELISGIRVIKNFVQEKGAIKDFQKDNQGYLDKAIALIRYSAAFDPFLMFFANLAIAIILYLGGVKVIFGTITLGDFVAFTGYLNILIWPMIALGWVINLLQRGRASMKRILNLLESKSLVIDKGKKQITIKGNIEIKNLTFSYNGIPVLKNINLEFPNRKFIAIVGKTGSGKTTLIDLIMRFYSSSGIFVDGIPIEEIPLKTLRSAIRYIPQETFLFSDSIKNNIAFGKFDTEEDNIIQVAKMAQIYDEITEIPEGFDARLGEKGINLSGGQKQRIAIARALLIKPQIVIFDDALSSVDSNTEKAIMENIKEFLEERTSIVISHRLSAIQDADEIIVLSNGEIVERGRHRELIKKEGIYYEMYTLQMIKERLEKND